MDHLKRLGNSISVKIHSDEDGFIGRECPNSECEGYFKVESGTGIQEENLPCICPYCGHTASHDNFRTTEQSEYAKSVAFREINEAVRKDLKKLEFDHKPKGPFGIGFSMKLQPGPGVPLHYYREKELETEIVCSNCTLRYSVYGVFAFCPDCGVHNSLQILDKSLEVVEKMLNMAETVESDIATMLVENALEDCLSTFDGFGRALVLVHREKASYPDKIGKISFQNLDGANKNLLAAFGIDLSVNLTVDEWEHTKRSFQKRHLLAHKMGVIDKDYIRRSGDSSAIPGRKIAIEGSEVHQLTAILRKLSRYLVDSLNSI